MRCCKDKKWMMALCFAPILLFILLKIFFPQFAYLSFLALLICPVSMGLAVIFMGKEGNCGHSEKKNCKQKAK